MPTPEHLLVQNVIDLRRFENGLRARILRILDGAFHEIANEILSGSHQTPISRRRLAALFRRTDAMLRSAYAEARVLAPRELAALARIQGRYAEQVIQSLGAAANVEIQTTRLTATQLRAIAELPVQGLPVSDWWNKMSADAALRTRQQIQLGAVQGESMYAIARRVAPLDISQGASAMLSARRQATALVRTMVTAVAAESSFQTFSNLDPDVSDSYQYVATLDDRTTMICASLDGKIFRYDDIGAPRPPMHINCRSTIIPAINWDKLGVQAPENLQQVSRAAVGGPITYRTYSGWLRRQPAEIQDNVLGAERGRLFRAGKVSLQDLVRSDGTAYTVKQLEARLN